MNKRYYFLQDESCHWYQIPVELKDEFYKLMYDEDNTGKEAWERPEWNKFELMALGGGIEQISFLNPIKDE